jgi:hypothetical protein
MKNLLCSSLIALAAGCALHADPVITLGPSSGNVTGPAGGDAGWGFTMTSDPKRFISVFQSVLIGQTNSLLGFYTDFIGAEGGPTANVFQAGAPAWAQSFDDSSHGIGAFSINPGAVVGATDSGSIEIQYGMYSSDPNHCGACTVDVQTVDLPFRVTVTSPSTVPEPSYMWLLAAGCGCIALQRLRRILWA